MFDNPLPLLEKQIGPSVLDDLKNNNNNRTLWSWIAHLSLDSCESMQVLKQIKF